MVMVMSMLATAYALLKIIDATVTTQGVISFFWKARYESVVNNFIGAWELVNVLAFETWALIIWILGWYIGYFMWDKFDQLHVEGRLTQLEGWKYLLLGFVAAAGIWITGLAVGDMSSDTLGFFDAYDTKKEQYDIVEPDVNQLDPYGTSFFVDVSPPR